MKRRLFEDLVLSAAGRPARRGFAWPVSVTVHAAVVAGLLALPALTTEALPDPPPPLPLPHVVAVAVISPPPVPRPQARPRTPRPPESRPTAPTAPPQPVDARPMPNENMPLLPTADDGAPKDGVICLGCESAPAIDVGALLGPPSGGNGTATDGRPHPIGGDIQPPNKLRDVRPIYPDLAKAVRAQGLVVVECIIAPDGRVDEVRVVSGHPLLQKAAVDAVQQWRYTPTRLNGIPVAVVMTVTVNFILQ